MYFTVTSLFSSFFKACEYFAILTRVEKHIQRDGVSARKLIEVAHKILGEYTLSNDKYSAGSVAAALLTSQGNIYTGINIDIACGIGFCAEHSAIAEMLKHRETEIEMIVAVSSDGIRPPCGRCRELLFQVDAKNIHTKVYLSEEKYMTINELLPHRWESRLG